MKLRDKIKAAGLVSNLFELFFQKLATFLKVSQNFQKYFWTKAKRSISWPSYGLFSLEKHFIFGLSKKKCPILNFIQFGLLVPKIWTNYENVPLYWGLTHRAGASSICAPIIFCFCPIYFSFLISDNGAVVWSLANCYSGRPDFLVRFLYHCALAGGTLNNTLALAWFNYVLAKSKSVSRK